MPPPFGRTLLFVLAEEKPGGLSASRCSSREFLTERSCLHCPKSRSDTFVSQPTPSAVLESPSDESPSVESPQCCSSAKWPQSLMATHTRVESVRYAILNFQRSTLTMLR